MSSSLQNFIKDATRTESKIEQVVINKQFLASAITLTICANIFLDQIKKNTFYKKPYNANNLLSVARNAELALAALNNYAIDTAQQHESIRCTPIESKQEKLTVDPRIFHAIIGIATESSELLETLYYTIYNEKPIDAINLIEECGDIDWYKAILMDAVDGDWDKSLEAVIAKLRTRYPEKFTSENAINRDLNTERTVLEKHSK